MALLRLGRVVVCGLLAALAWAGTQAAVTTSVVDIATRPGVTQRILYVRPDVPVATIVFLPGSDGILGIQSDGSMPTNTGRCGPFARNRNAFAERGFAMALVDQASDGQIRQYTDIREVVRYVRDHDNVPVWVAGGSASTSAALNFAIDLPLDEPMGAIFFSPVNPDLSRAGQMKRPALVIFHTADFMAVPDMLLNTLTAAPVKERIALSGGNDGDCGGYHLFWGLDAEFVAATAGFVDKYNATLAPAAPPVRNYQGLWYNSPAESEAGWGINFAHQGDVIFATWFTYDATGRAWWLTMTATKIAEGVYRGTLNQTDGPAFNAQPFNPALVSPTPVGEGTLTFSDANNGSFAYTVNGISQTRNLVRQVFGPVPTCVFGAQPNLALATNYQDLWYAAPAESEAGWGVNFTHQGDIIFATWFTYDFDGSPLWLSGTAHKSGPGVYGGTLNRTTGPAFSAQPWNKANVDPIQVGTYTLTFANGNSGSFAYSLTLGTPPQTVTQTKAITRQVFRTPGTMCQ